MLATVVLLEFAAGVTSCSNDERPVTVQARETIAMFVAPAGECTITIGQTSADRLSGAFSCSNLSDGSNEGDVTGSFSARG